jgi:hypothetical protein
MCRCLIDFRVVIQVTRIDHIKSNNRLVGAIGVSLGYVCVCCDVNAVVQAVFEVII